MDGELLDGRQLNELCAKGDLTDDARFVFGRRRSVGEIFCLERPHLRELPEAFDHRRLLLCRVDAKARICVRQGRYSVPVRFAGSRLEVRLGAETVEAYSGASLVACHPRSTGIGTETLDLDHYLEVFSVKPGALPGATALHQARASGAFSAVHDAYFAAARRRLGDQEGVRAMVEVLLAHRQLPADALICGMRGALAAGVVDPAVVLVEARRVLDRSPAIVELSSALSRFDRPAPSLSGYDELLEDAR